MIVIGAITAPPASSKGVDIEVIIDISGSMSGTDPQFLRKDAMRALLGLVGKNDRLGAVGFDDQFEPIFDLQGVTDANSGALASLADQHILDRGGTDYNVAFAKGYEALTAPAVYDAARPKYVIFLTDGGHNASDYNNGHLLMAANPTGRPWPVCAIQLGTQFQPADVVRLQRIATETGGQYATATTNAALSDDFRRCLGAATNQTTIVDKNVTFKVTGKAKTLTKRISAKLQRREVLRQLHAGRQARPGARRSERQAPHAGHAGQERRLPAQRHVLPLQGAPAQEGQLVGRDDAQAARAGQARRARQRDGAAHLIRPPRRRAGRPPGAVCEHPPMSEVPARADVVVIGGGAVGASTAFHLATGGVADVVLLERETLASGSTSRSAGGARLQFADELNVGLSLRSLDEFERWDELIGEHVDVRARDRVPPGTATSSCSTRPSRSSCSARRSRCSTPRACPRASSRPPRRPRSCPQLELDGILAATFCPRDGHMSPEAVVQGYAAAAVARGARVLPGLPGDRHRARRRAHHRRAHRARDDRDRHRRLRRRRVVARGRRDGRHRHPRARRAAPHVVLARARRPASTTCRSRSTSPPASTSTARARASSSAGARSCSRRSPSTRWSGCR